MSTEQPTKDNLHLDEVTGEMVSKNELKRRQKQRQRDAERAAKPSGEETAEAASKAYREARLAEVARLKDGGKSPYVYKVHIT